MTQDSIITSDGYSQEIFAVPLLAATFGVPEKTIMKYGVRQRSKLLKACDKNFLSVIFSKDKAKWYIALSYLDN